MPRPPMPGQALRIASLPVRAAADAVGAAGVAGLGGEDGHLVIELDLPERVVGWSLTLTSDKATNQIVQGAT